MKYRKNIKNDNKNIKSIRYAKSYRFCVEYIHTVRNICQQSEVNERWETRDEGRETRDAREKRTTNILFCRLIILLMHEIVCTIDDVQ